MFVVIAGAGSVGVSIARELMSHGHSVSLIDEDPEAMKVASAAQAEWILGDCCSPEILEQAHTDQAQVVVAATGDDRANLVLSLLAKTHFSVPRVVARVNEPKNEWMFDDSWGVDVQVSTPRIMTSLVQAGLADTEQETDHATAAEDPTSMNPDADPAPQGPPASAETV